MKQAVRRVPVVPCAAGCVQRVLLLALETGLKKIFFMFLPQSMGEENEAFKIHPSSFCLQIDSPLTEDAAGARIRTQLTQEGSCCLPLHSTRVPLLSSSSSRTANTTDMGA